MVFDRFMLLSRLKEEEQIIVIEVKQHWQSLKEAECSLRDLSVEIQNNNSDFELSEGSSNGLLCLLKRKLEDLQFQLFCSVCLHLTWTGKCIRICLHIL
ncbi:hypothetical protein G5714_010983 [Onychostoma macrolepis]|uniref:Uncharacterized protein n=1 Tax=Onychostoma macrolepis TaxID=369639 RepID=A0A7J6CME5_9TELE|nr:hypothetical protein G5714_010983 [Onychostoma macrolepis]